MSAEELDQQQRQHMRRVRRSSRMGDLTEPLRRERGEQIIASSSFAPRGEPADLPPNGYVPPVNTAPVVATAAQRETRIAAGVEAVYQTMPANAGKANFSDRILVEESIGTPGIFRSVTALRERIPKGRVFFATKLRVNVVAVYQGDTPVGIPQNFIELAISRNGSIEVFNQDITVAPLDGFMEVSLWAGPDDVVEVKFSANYSSLVSELPVFAQLEINLVGDMLLTNDAPYPYTGLNRK